MPMPTMKEKTSAVMTSSMGGMLKLKYGAMAVALPRVVVICVASTIEGKSSEPVP